MRSINAIVDRMDDKLFSNTTLKVTGAVVTPTPDQSAGKLLISSEHYGISFNEIRVGIRFQSELRATISGLFLNSGASRFVHETGEPREPLYSFGRLFK